MSVSQSKSSEFVCHMHFQLHMSKSRKQIELTHTNQEYVSTSFGTNVRNFVCNIHQILDLTLKLAHKPTRKSSYEVTKSKQNSTFSKII